MGRSQQQKSQSCNNKNSHRSPIINMQYKNLLYLWKEFWVDLKFESKF